MALENVPASVQSDGNWRITNVPAGSNAKSVAILNGATAKPITYGLASDGFTSELTQATIPDGRLTLKQDLSRPGKVTATASFKAVASTNVDSADQILKAHSLSGLETQFLVRRGVDNATTHTVAQVGDLLTGVVGVRRPTAPVENGLDYAEYALFLTKPTEEVTLVA